MSEPLSEPQRVEVEILGQKYTIRSEADPKHIRDLAAYVEKRAKSVEGQLRSPDPVKALALASLYIADELFRTREELAKFEGDLPKRIGAMVDLLDAITPGKGQR
jgi:cell division protein ZapA (FtsZ GTPase activity inhibitor)